MSQNEDTLVSAPAKRQRVRLSRRTVLALAAVVAACVIAFVLASGVFGGGTASSRGRTPDNGFATSLATVMRRSLSSQMQVSATLGYAHPSTVVVPAGTLPQDLAQERQAVASARAQLTTAHATLSTDTATLGQADAGLSADRAKLAVDCAGDNAGASAASSSGGASAGSGAGSTPCASDAQSMSTDEQGVTLAGAKVAGDRQAVPSATTALASAQAGLAQAEVSATAYGQSATYTELPAVGQIVARGETLYETNGQPVVSLYGSAAPWRAFRAGMPPGRDVAELNENLHALGYPTGLAGQRFTSATRAAIGAFQSARGGERTGELLLGSVAFEPGPVRVTSVTPTLGATVQPGPVLTVTSVARQVTIELDAAQQAEVKVGDPVTITLPDQRTTPGTVTYVGTVATTPASSADQGGGNGPSTPTIEVDITPTHAAATGHLDQAPVDVSITTVSVRSALAVPVAALLALAGGGYAVEEIGANGVHHLVAAGLGIFDDADGLVQVTGAGLAAGQRIVVPGE